MSESQISYLSQSSLKNSHSNRHNQQLRKSLPPCISVTGVLHSSLSPSAFASTSSCVNNFVPNLQGFNVIKSSNSKRIRSNSGSAVSNNIHEPCNCQHSSTNESFASTIYKTQTLCHQQFEENNKEEVKPYSSFKRKQTRPSALKNPKHMIRSGLSSSSSFYGVGIPTTIQTAKRTNTATVKNATKSVYFSPELKDCVDDEDDKCVKTTKDEQLKNSSKYNGIRVFF